MVTYNRILMAVPHRYAEDATIDHAVSVARQHNARLTLFGVVEEIEKEYENWLTTKLPQDLEHEMYETQLAALQKRVADLKPTYDQVDCAVSKGIPFVEIIRQVVRGDHDLLILDATTRHPGRKRFMGSTTKHVLRKCPCPVLCIREQTRPGKVAAAVDVFADKPGAAELNRKVLTYAYDQAQREGAQLHVVYAQQPIGEPMLSAWGVGSADMLDGMEADLIASAETKLLKLTEDVCGGSDGIVMQTVLGNPRDALPLYMRDNRIDLLTMGTVCRTGIKGFLIGNTAESILNEVTCSVLALKPEGFVSPVE
ncbi:MAG: universal stress protein [Pseudomonadota bacterium]|nr:universal stress protein [Pseudomonadota bacterium]